MTRLRKLALAFETLLVFLFLDRVLKRWPFEKVYQRVVICSQPATRPDGEGLPLEVIAQVTEAVAAATRWYYRRREDCLPRSLALCRLLRRRGLPAELCLGVRQFPFTAHAWIECEGELIDDSPMRVGRYQVLARLGTSINQ